MSADEKGLTRSSYGLQTYTPEEMKQQWRESMKNLGLSLFADIAQNPNIKPKVGELKMRIHALKLHTHFKKRERDSFKNHFIYKCRNEELMRRWHEGPQLDLSTNPTYFNNEKKNNSKSTYDRMFHIQHGYCSTIHRDDREHMQGLAVHAEEKSKKVPLLSSTIYGHRPPLEVPSRQHVRVGLVKRDFYRHCGATMPSGDP